MFKDLVDRINRESIRGFTEATRVLVEYVDCTDGFLEILKEIGTIPESIAHDSTEEKLFAKVSDAVLARAFREIGLKSRVLVERADAADVFAESPIYGYTLVADAKAFRMSRTAKNQKDFKVVALSNWRVDADYAVLCSPFFHYPNTRSQIYEQALTYNVCLLTWEHIIFLIENNIKEDEHINLSKIWNFSMEHSEKVLMTNRKKYFLKEFTDVFIENLNFQLDHFELLLLNQKMVLSERSRLEIGFWEHEIELIRNLTKEQAIEELIISRKIREKMLQIETFIRRITI